MKKKEELIRESIIRDMSEGVMTVGLDGVIGYVNAAAALILDKEAEKLQGQKFMKCFFGYQENDAFNQMVLDAVYDASKSHKNTVSYFTGKETKQLHITASYLFSGEEKVGIILVISDISELAELRDAVKAMERIRVLNDQLEARNRLISETFGRFLSDEIVDQLLNKPDGLTMGGKKQVVTILMSDLRGFTLMSENMEPQRLINMLNHYLSEMTEIIQKRNGTIIDFIGDSIFAIFGAPVFSEDHAAEAVATAVEMQHRMKDVNQWNRENGYPLLEMGIGVHTGEVIIGNMGSEKRTKYGTVGKHVSLCEGIEAYTVGGQILISPRTKEKIKEPLYVVKEQVIHPQGVSEAVTVSQVSGIGGRFNLIPKEKMVTLENLSVPQKVSFYKIKDKHKDFVPKVGFLTALSRTGAILQTNEELSVHDNLQIDANGNLFCKVVARETRGWILHFTAMSPGFQTWYKMLQLKR